MSFCCILQVVRDVLVPIRVTISFGLEGLSFVCIVSHTYLSKLLLSMATPVVAAALIVVFSMIRSKTWYTGFIKQLPNLFRVAFLW